MGGIGGLLTEGGLVSFSLNALNRIGDSGSNCTTDVKTLNM